VQNLARAMALLESNESFDPNARVNDVKAALAVPVHITQRLLLKRAEQLGYQDLKDVKELSLSGLSFPRGRIKRVECLALLPSLENLDLSHNKIVVVHQWTTLSLRLTHLNLASNELRSLKGIGHLVGLQTLNVEDNRLLTLSPDVADLSQLR
jgi:Leucine-rich repeat (LRR) protein